MAAGVTDPLTETPPAEQLMVDVRTAPDPTFRPDEPVEFANTPQLLPVSFAFLSRNTEVPPPARPSTQILAWPTKRACEVTVIGVTVLSTKCMKNGCHCSLIETFTAVKSGRTSTVMLRLRPARSLAVAAAFCVNR